MRNKILFLILVIFSSFSFAQNLYSQQSTPAGTITLVDKQLYYDGDAIDVERFQEIISSDPEARSEYGTAKAFSYTAYAFSYTGGFCLGYGVVALLQSDSELGLGLTLGGLGGVGIAFLFTHIANTYIKSAIDIFNNHAQGNSFRNTEVSLVPTPQGGVALAFSF